MSENTNNTSEEVDLGKLFALIGSGFKNVFNGILNGVKFIFHYTIVILIFFKKYAVILGGTTILGFAIGYFVDSSKEPVYASDMVAEINFKSGHELYNKTNYLNTLITKEDFIELAKVFNLTKEEASALTSFSIEPYEKEKYTLKEYDRFIRDGDTLVTKNVTYDDFMFRIGDPDFHFQKITAFSSNQEVFTKLNGGFEKLVETEYFNKILKLKTEDLVNREQILQKSLIEIDSLRNRYANVALLNAKKDVVGGTSIDLSGKKDNRNNDVDLFRETERIMHSLHGISKEKIKELYIISILNKFTVGYEYNRILSRSSVRLALLGFFIALLVIISLKVNTFISNYKV